MQKTTVYLSPELRRAIRELARREGRPQAELIRSALQAYAGAQPRPLPTSLGAGDDPELTGAESEDYLQRRWDGAGADSETASGR